MAGGRSLFLLALRYPAARHSGLNRRGSTSPASMVLTPVFFLTLDSLTRTST